jgi:hypothetical protein
LEGSFADGQRDGNQRSGSGHRVPRSLETGEVDEARKLAAGGRPHESLELDVGVYDELSLSRGVAPMLKLGAR